MNPRRRISQRTQAVAYEALEPRQLLAGVTFDALTGVILIQGSVNKDTALVSTESDRIVVQLSGFSQSDFLASEVQEIVFLGGFGDDFFRNDTTVKSRAYGHSGADTLVGGAGVDVLFGGSGDDRLIGNEGADELNGSPGDDFLLGGGGNDLILGGSGDDRIYGNSGNDTLIGGQQNDLVFGSAGDDLIQGNNGDDILIGSQGDDHIIGSLGNDQIWGNQGADYVAAGPGDDWVVGGADNDRIFGGTGNDYLRGSTGDDFVSTAEGWNEIYGDAGSDELIGGSGPDKIFGGADADVIFGLAGDDELYGQDGADIVHGGAGADRIIGSFGNDILTGGIGDDYLNGGEGNDELSGDVDSDRLFGNEGNDLLRGGTGNDYLDGGSGDDWLYGHAGNDSLFAGLGFDHLYGHSGNDSLTVNGDNDIANGGPGIDVFYGASVDFEDATPLDHWGPSANWSGGAYVDGDNNIWLKSKSLTGPEEVRVQLGPTGVIAKIWDDDANKNLLAPSYQGEITDRVVQWVWWAGWNGVVHDNPDLPIHKDRFNITQAGTFDNVLGRTFDVDWDPAKGQVDVWSESVDQWKSEQDPYMQGSFSMLTRTKIIGEGAILIRRVIRVGKVTLEGSETSFTEPYFEAWTPFSDSQLNRVAFAIDDNGKPTEYYTDDKDIPHYEHTPVAETRGWVVAYNKIRSDVRPAVAVVYGTQDPCTYANGVCTKKGRAVLNLFDFKDGLAVLPAIQPGPVVEGTVLDITMLLVPMRGIQPETAAKLDSLAAKIPAPRIFMPGTTTDPEITAIRERLEEQVGTPSQRTSQLGDLL